MKIYVKLNVLQKDICVFAQYNNNSKILILDLNIMMKMMIYNILVFNIQMILMKKMIFMMYIEHIMIKKYLKHV